MGFDDALNKAKDHAKNNPDQVDKAFDAGTEQVTDRTPDQYDDKVQQGSDAARDHLTGGNDQDAQQK